MNARVLIPAVVLLFARSGLAAQPEAPAEIFIVPNFHPASCGWLTDWSKASDRIWWA